MNSEALANSFVVLGAGLLASSVSSFLEMFAIFGTATGCVRGVFDGLSVVAFGVATVIPIRSRSVPRECDAATNPQTIQSAVMAGEAVWLTSLGTRNASDSESGLHGRYE